MAADQVGIAKRARGRPRSAGQDGAPGASATVQALDRGLSLLAALARDGKATLSVLAQRAGMPPSSAHRLLATLEAHGLVELGAETQEWMVGVEAFRIGSAFVQRGNLAEMSREAMRRLVEDTGETANLAIADGAEVVFLSQVESPHPIRAFFRPGTRAEMHCSGIGKALLAAFGRARAEALMARRGLPGYTPRTLTRPEALFADLGAAEARGWALDDEERHEGMRCIAAAIFNAFGEPVAGLSISGPRARFADDMLPGMGARVRRAADEVTALTGGRRPGGMPWG